MTPARAREGGLAGVRLDLGSGEASQPTGTVDLEIDAQAAPRGEPLSDENVKVVGPLRIGIPLFNIYLNEADELSRRLMTEVAEWAMELHRPVGEVPIALAHSLAGSSATVGFTDLSQLARSLEHALARSQVIGHGTERRGAPVRQRGRGDPPPAAPVRRRLPAASPRPSCSRVSPSTRSARRSGSKR